MFGIVKSHHPATVGLAVHVQNTQVHGRCLLAFGCLALPPNLETAGVQDPGLTVEIESVENEGLSLCVKDAAEGFLCTATAVDIKYIGNIQFPRAHQFPDISIGAQVLLCIFETAFLFPILYVELLVSCFNRSRPKKGFVSFRS